MSFEGDKERYVPDWQSRLDEHVQREGLSHPEEVIAKQQYIERGEVALKHPKTRSMVRIKNDGGIDLFAGNMLGISIDPSSNSVNIFGDNLNFFGKRVNIKTNPDGLIWNGNHFNPELYLETSTARDQYVSGTKEYWIYSEEEGWHWERGDWSVKPFLKAKSGGGYSDGMVAIMRSLGLPIE